jgi:hypothetical protein
LPVQVCISLARKGFSWQRVKFGRSFPTWSQTMVPLLSSPSPFGEGAALGLIGAVAALAGVLLFHPLVPSKKTHRPPLPPSPPGELFFGHYRVVPTEAPFKKYAEWGKQYSTFADRGPSRLTLCACAGRQSLTQGVVRRWTCRIGCSLLPDVWLEMGRPEQPQSCRRPPREARFQLCRSTPVCHVRGVRRLLHVTITVTHTLTSLLAGWDGLRH